MRLLAVLMTLALATPAICQEIASVTTLPESPHRYMTIQGECVTCHDLYLGVPDPHKFVVPITGMCLRESCHSPQNIGRSHPVGVNLKSSLQIEAIPESLPLEDGMISCGSCHEPHGQWLSATPCYFNQPPAVYLAEMVGDENRETPYFSTYFLRVIGNQLEGFAALCNSCHKR